MTWQELLRLVRKKWTTSVTINRAGRTVEATLPTYEVKWGKKVIQGGGATIRLLDVPDSVILEFEEAVRE